jgi:outer membrane protein OmpA-like peptidoglycan-associated protein
MDRGGSKWPVLLLIVALALTAGVGALYWWRPPRPLPAPPSPGQTGGIKAPEAPVRPRPVPGLDPLPRPEADDPKVSLADAGVNLGDLDPAALVERIGRALEQGDLEAALRMVGKDVISPEQIERLRALAAQSRLRLRGQNPVREVGELKWNELARWALQLEETPATGGRPGQIFFDLRKKDGRWVVEKVTLPPGDGLPPRASMDALGIADAFLMAALRQDFELARAFVDSKRVSDAKIAGLCILFEEGHYRLRPQKPIRAVFERNDLAGFLANVEASDGTEVAQFALNLGRQAPEQPWIVREINLDQLLADYARRVAGGDVYYTPLVPNPQGGDTLVLYFEFDQDTLTARSERQLEIVAQILRTDPGKKLTISGHTDALGSEDYNQALSSRRAAAVRNYIVSAGVEAAQIITVAKGLSQPRRPNRRDDGTDNPEGRRANRRSEIYLDF